MLQFIKNMIYFNKLIDICINRYESQKVVDNYANGTIRAPIVSKDTFGAFIIKIILNLLIIKKTGNDYDTATGK